MKLILTLITFISISLSANENWIKIEPLNKTKTPKPKNKIDVNLSQIEPINKMIRNATAIKQIVDATSKKEKRPTNDKNWFVLNNEKSK